MTKTRTSGKTLDEEGRGARRRGGGGEERCHGHDRGNLFFERRQGTGPSAGCGGPPITPRAALPSDARQPRCAALASPLRAANGRGVAQPGSASHWGCGGRWFESSRPDHLFRAGSADGPACKQLAHGRRRRTKTQPGRSASPSRCSPFRCFIFFAALIGSLIPVNSAWAEPDKGVTIYIADNGVHADLILPAEAQGLDWRPLVPRSRLRRCAGRRAPGSLSARESGGSISKRRPGAT